MIKKIENTEYFVDDEGNVYRNNKKLKPQNCRGYSQIKLYPEKKWYKIHFLVANAFISNPLNLTEINHLNRIKSDNRVVNLVWCSHQDNMKHSYETGHKRKKNEEHHNCKLSNEDIVYIRTHYISGDKEYGQGALSRRFGVNQSTIFHILHNNRRLL